MPERIVVVGELLYSSDKFGDREDGYALFDRYKDDWVMEVMENAPDEEFRDDLFDSYEEYMKFWGTDDLCYATGSVYAKKYKNFTDEDEKFYKKLVDEAEEKNELGFNEKNNIFILKPHLPSAKNVKMRCRYEWQEMKKKG